MSLAGINGKDGIIMSWTSRRAQMRGIVIDNRLIALGLAVNVQGSHLAGSHENGFRKGQDLVVSKRRLVRLLVYLGPVASRQAKRVLVGRPMGIGSWKIGHVDRQRTELAAHGHALDKDMLEGKEILASDRKHDSAKGMVFIVCRGRDKERA